ncbi:MAG: hypothetical protein QOF84_2375 [Streptomyces sp.]|nr:hypothetical protein [Streptomyces sp.]
MKNTSHHTCVLRGYPGVDLYFKDFAWSLKRSDVHPAEVTLRPGRSAHFTIGYERVLSDDSRAVKPTKVVVTPPGQRISVHPVLAVR